MAVLINFKICDQAKECNGIAVCPTGALFWDERSKSIKIDNKKCISCGKCKKSCMVNAIFVAKNEKEYKRIENEIKKDKRKSSDLYIDRYGAQPIHAAFLITEGKFDLEVLQWHKTIAVELYDDDSIMCLLRSIPMKKLLPEGIKYRKTEADEKLLKTYKIKKLPALLFFENGKILGKVEGYFDNKKEKVLLEKISKITRKNFNMPNQ